MSRKRGVIAAAVALAATVALMTETGASGRGPLKLAGQGSATEARFGLDRPTDGPFPSDWFTVPDHTNKTHRRVHLPLPDCEQYVSDCQDLAVLNELDGFNLRPRLSVPFSGPIDPNTVTSHTVFLVSLGIIGPGQDYMPWGTVIGIDQVVWDPVTSTLHVESDELLAQHTRFALIVTRGIHDPNGAAIEASDAFRRFRADVREDYKQDLLEALQAARAVGVSERDIAVAGVFSTQSVTAVLEKIRDQIHAATPDPADLLLGPNGERTVFTLDAGTSILWTQAPGATPVPVSLLPVRTTFPGAVGVVAFGKYRSPDYLEHPHQYMEPVGTRTGTPVVRGTSDIYFNLFLPSGPEPSGGWPVAIFGHGVNGNKNVQPLSVVSTLAHYGIATIAINMVGHGLGADGTLTVSGTSGGALSSVTVPAGGRGIDQNGDSAIGTSEGANASGDRAIVFSSDAFRQTAADLMQLVRVIGVGIDVDGDGTPDLDPSRVYYFGNSWGAAYGLVFLAVEPDARVGVFAVPSDSIPIGPLCVFRARSVAAILSARRPSLLNTPGITDLGGLAFGAPTFDENLPLREQVPLVVGFADSSTRTIQSPVTNTIAGAIEIQNVFEHYEWVGEAGSPAAYAPHLRRASLAGVPAKSVLFLLAEGDQSAPNPTTTAILRAGDLADRALWYRHDQYWASWTSCPATAGKLATAPNPHSFVSGLTDTFFRPLSLAAQQTAGDFFASDGGQINVTQPGSFAPGCTPPPLFEFPIPLPLPEGLNYIK